MLHGAVDADSVEAAGETVTQAVAKSGEVTGFFRHIFGGDGYAAGYYAYLWSEVLDADGFKAFAEAHDPFDPATAQRLHKFIYSAGGTRDFAAAYRAFRGRDPRIEALLEGRGLLAPAA